MPVTTKKYPRGLGNSHHCLAAKQDLKVLDSLADRKGCTASELKNRSGYTYFTLKKILARLREAELINYSKSTKTWQLIPIK